MPARHAVLVVLFLGPMLPVGVADDVPVASARLEAPPRATAGEGLPFTAVLDWATGIAPPHRVRVEAALDGPDENETAATESTRVGGGAPTRVPLVIPVLHAGARTLTVRLNATPGGAHVLVASVDVRPDNATITLAADPMDGFRGNVTVGSHAQRLNGTVGRLVVTATSATEPPFVWTVHDVEAALPVHVRAPFVARHGPGTYMLTARLVHPDAVAPDASVVVRVAEPPTNASAPVRFDVERPPATIRLTDDTVNADNKAKAPGVEVVTRASVAGGAPGDVVTASVYRLRPTRTPIASSTMPVPADGAIEHRWSHAPLAVGLHAVELAIGSARVERTFNVTDRAPSALVAPAAAIVWPGGAPALATVTLLDPNFGSTPEDPGPIRGFPDVRLRLLRGTQEPATAFRMQLGDWTMGTSATVPTSELQWPKPGFPLATGDGLGGVHLPLAVQVPRDATPGAYRASVYHGTTRLGGLDLDVQALPTLALVAPHAPEPGTVWSVRLNASTLPPGAAATLFLTVADGAPVRQEAAVPSAVTFDMPDALMPGTPVTLQAILAWPRGPATGVAAWSNTTIAARAPVATVSLVVDGTPVDAPRLHPASGHTLDVLVAARDPHGGEPTTTVRITDWNGTDAAWPIESLPDGQRIHVPGGATPGAYTVRVEIAGAGGATTHETTALVAIVRGIRVGGALAGAADPGRFTPLGTLVVHNTGNVPFAGLRLDVDDDALTLRAPPGLLERALAPGAALEVPLEAAVSQGAPSGTRLARVTVWGNAS